MSGMCRKTADYIGGGAGGSDLTASITASSSQTDLTAFSTTITPSGGTSYTYSGTLHAPPGSSAALSASNIANPSVTPDRAGRYVVELTATDATGFSVTKTRSQAVGINGFVTSYAKDYTTEANSTAAATPWQGWTISNLANGAISYITGTGLSIVTGATGSIGAATRNLPLLSQTVDDIATHYQSGRHLLIHLQLGSGTAIDASTRFVGLFLENPANLIGAAGTTERGCGVLWRNNGGTKEVSGLMMGHSSGSSIVLNAYAQASASVPAVLGIELFGHAVRVGFATSSAAYLDPAGASWSWGGWYGIDYDGDPPEMVPGDMLLSLAANANSTLILEKMGIMVGWL